jgi:hypothetical protein
LLLLLPGSAVVAYALAAVALRAFVRRHPVVVQREGISVWWPLRGKSIAPWHLIVSARSARRWRASDLVLQVQGSRWPGRIPMQLERPLEFAAAVERHAGSQHPLTAVLRERAALRGASPAHDLS